MSDRIDIAELRKRAEHGREIQVIVPARDLATVTWDEVLALVDVAEAARTHERECIGEDRFSSRYNLGLALDRFDFGDA